MEYTMPKGWTRKAKGLTSPQTLRRQGFALTGSTAIWKRQQSPRQPDMVDIAKHDVPGSGHTLADPSVTSE